MSPTRRAIELLKGCRRDARAGCEFPRNADEFCDFALCPEKEHPEMFCPGVRRKKFRDRACAFGDCPKCGLVDEYVLKVSVEDNSCGGVELEDGVNWVSAISAQGKAADVPKCSFLGKVNGVYVRNRAEAFDVLNGIRQKNADSQRPTKTVKVSYFAPTGRALRAFGFLLNQSTCSWKEWKKVERGGGRTEDELVEVRDRPQWELFQKLVMHSLTYFPHDWSDILQLHERRVVLRTFDDDTIVVCSDFAAQQEARGNDRGTCATSTHVNKDIFVVYHSPRDVEGNRVCTVDVWTFFFPARSKHKDNVGVGA